jgi:hypothetical protein
MARRLPFEDGGQSLKAHLAARGDEIRAKYGPQLGWSELLRLLEDRTFVRYPCEIQFDGGPLLPGELGHALAKGACPEEGFVIHVHPRYATKLALVPYLVLYQLALVNHGEVISPDDAETFGCHALGLSKDQYYHTLCDLAGQIGGDEMV